VVQLEGHAIEQILGGAHLLPEQFAVIVNGAPALPSSE